jgi:hypothetical protein
MTDILHGPIGFFDILGYQSLLENNKTEDDLNNIAFKALKIINEIENENLSNWNIYDADKKIHNSIDNYIKRLIFSDTIILSLDLSSSLVRKIGNDSLWHIFIKSCGRLYQHMFSKGLPLRGAIDFGKYIINGNSFVGSPIIEAYKLSNKLDLSACVLTRDAAKEISNLLYKMREDYPIEYLVPTKEGDEKLFTLNANPCDPDKDIREQVLSSFWQHNKDIAKSVKSKVDNTVQWLTYLRMKENENKA